MPSHLTLKEVADAFNAEPFTEYENDSEVGGSSLVPESRPGNGLVQLGGNAQGDPAKRASTSSIVPALGKFEDEQDYEVVDSALLNGSEDVGSGGEGSNAGTAELSEVSSDSPPPIPLGDLLEVPKPKLGLNWRKLFDPSRPKPEPWATRDGFVYGYRGEVINMVADAGLGKSWLALDITRAMITEPHSVAGIDFTPGRVMWIDEEGYHDLLVERLALFGLTERDLEGKVHYLLQKGIRLDDPRSFEGVEHDVAVFRPQVIIIDSRIRVSSIDENSNAEQAKLFNDGIRPLSRRYDATVIVIDHTKKDSQDKRLDNRMRGAGEKTAQGDRNWVLEMSYDDRVKGVSEFFWRHGKTRRGAPPPDLLVTRRVTDGRLRHTGRVIGGGR